MTLLESAVSGRRAAERLVAVVSSLSSIALSPGLTAAEFAVAEERFGFTFADDHRAFLAAVLPVGPRWPDWRTASERVLQQQWTWPVRGVLFDVEHNVFWSDLWGPRPESLPDALAVAEERLAAVPRLVPVYGHRYLPAGRGTWGHPVLSVYQSDVIYYGLDLDDYVHREFEVAPGSRWEPDWRPRATVPFWRDLLG